MIFKSKKFYITISIIISCFIAIKLSFMNSSILANTNPNWDNWEFEESKRKYIKWVDFTPNYDVLSKTAKLDIDSHNNNELIKFNWIELISYLSCKYGGNFDKFNDKDLNDLVKNLKNGKTMEELTSNYKYYSYYFEAYDAVLHEFIGEYMAEIKNSDGTSSYIKKYGIKVYLPIAANYSFSHYDDFGNSRSYGYKRVHLGNDLMGNIGTPIIAVESGVVEALGWNQYGGWRIGIRSFDGKRYYYYAHLRKDRPYAENLALGQTVTAGDVIGYLGMTGYSTKENVNNINVPHLHFGIQLIFDEVQKDGVNQIWIDVFQIIEFLRKNKSQVYRNTETYEFYRKNKIIDLSIPEENYNINE